MIKSDNIDSVIKSLDHEVKDIIDRVNKAKKTIAIDILKGVIRRSPVWSGPYVKSHQFGIGKVNRTAEIPVEMIDLGIHGFKLPSKMSKAEADALKLRTSENKVALLKSKKIPFETTIYISNSIKHAVQVEYIGWNFVPKTFKPTPPHHVYGLTYQLESQRFRNTVKLFLSKKARI